MRTIALSALLLIGLAGQSAAQNRAIIITMPDGKTNVAVVYLPSGPLVVTDLTFIRLDPPDPPSPTATAAIVLLETEEQSQELAILRVQMATDPTLADLMKREKLQVLDRDAKDQDNQPVPRVVAARQFVGNKPLPQLVGMSSAGSAVVAEPLPSTVAGILLLLRKWGVQ